MIPFLLTSACGSDEAAYTPAPTEALIAEIEALQGVTRVDIGAYDSAGVGSGPTYNGQVRIDDTSDPALILDQVFAILWQGNADAELNVQVRQGDTFYGIDAVGLDAASLKERYGPQPGTGVPPTDKPALELQE